MFQLFLNIKSKLIPVEIALDFFHVYVVLLLLSFLTDVIRLYWRDINILLPAIRLAPNRGTRMTIFYFRQLEFRVVVDCCLEMLLVVV